MLEMETSSLAQPSPGRRSRFSKALPEPPRLARNPVLVASHIVRRLRGDALPSAQPALPSNHSVSASASIPSNMTAKGTDAPLPALPSVTRVNSSPTVIPRRKPVGSGASVKTAAIPPPPPKNGEISPTDSISSLLSAYGTEDSGARYSVDTAATKHSFVDASPPKLPPKDSVVTTIVSPFSLPTPISNKMMQAAEGSQQQPGAPLTSQQNDGPPAPPAKDDTKPSAPTSPEPSSNTSRTSPAPASSQPSPRPQIWRRRSVKSDKPLAVPEKLKLAASHGSTDSPEQVTSTVITGSRTMDGTQAKLSPTLEGFVEGLPSRNIRPSAVEKALPSFPLPPTMMGDDKTRQSVDGFTQYAQDLGLLSPSEPNTSTSQHSPANMSPETRRPPTPEYAKDEAKGDDAAIYIPVSPMTPPQDKKTVAHADETNTLGTIEEDPVFVSAKSTPSASPAPPQGPLPSIPGLGSANLTSGPAPSPRPRVQSPSPPPAPAPAPNAAVATENPTLAPSPLAAPAPVVAPAAASTAAAAATPSPSIGPAAAMAPTRERSSSATSVPTISVVSSDDGDTSTIKASSPPQPAAALPTSTTALHITTTSEQPHGGIFHSQPASPTSPTDPRPGDPAYFPMRHYLAQPVAPGTVLAAPAIKATQLACFGGHYRFVPARNEAHPLACATCGVTDNEVRLTCAHCALRVCQDCCDVLMLNGRDVGQLVAMLKA